MAKACITTGQFFTWRRLNSISEHRIVRSWEASKRNLEGRRFGMEMSVKPVCKVHSTGRNGSQTKIQGVALDRLVHINVIDTKYIIEVQARDTGVDRSDHDAPMLREVLSSRSGSTCGLVQFIPRVSRCRPRFSQLSIWWSRCLWRISKQLGQSVLGCRFLAILFLA